MDHRRRNLGFFFDESIKRLPDKIAIIDLFGGLERCSTYRQLDRRMDCVASMLARLGVRRGERVAMLVGNRTEFIEFFFGSMRAGAIPLPLNTRLAGAALEQIVRDAACVLAIVDPSSNRDALSITARLPLRQRLLLDGGERGFQSFEEEMANRGPAVAAVFTMFLQHRDYLRTLDLGALRSMTIGSAVVAPELMDAVERALPHVKVSESYGLTEGGSPLRPPIDGRPVPRGSPGVPAPEIELRLIDPDGNETDEGELLIRCPYVCLGYHNEPEIT